MTKTRDPSKCLHGAELELMLDLYFRGAHMPLLLCKFPISEAMIRRSAREAAPERRPAKTWLKHELDEAVRLYRNAPEKWPAMRLAQRYGVDTEMMCMILLHEKDNPARVMLGRQRNVVDMPEVTTTFEDRWASVEDEIGHRLRYEDQPIKDGHVRTIIYSGLSAAPFSSGVSDVYETTTGNY